MTEEKTFTLTLTAKHLDVIAAGLGELPGKIMLPVWQEVMRQCGEQIAGTPKKAASNAGAPGGKEKA